MKYDHHLYRYIVHKQMTPSAFAESLGLERPDRLYNVLKGKNGLSVKFAKLISDTYNDINYDWLLTGEGEMIQMEGKSLDFVAEPKPEYNMELIPKKYEGQTLVKVVTTKARGGWTDSYYSDEYIKDMPTILIESDKDYKGNYLAFEVDGDSMEPDYYKGDIVICREVTRDHWKSKLFYKKYDFVIAHGTQGVMIKEIANHDVENGTITCRSLNNADGKHGDFLLKLSEIAFLFNIVEVRQKGTNKKLRR